MKGQRDDQEMKKETSDGQPRSNSPACSCCPVRVELELTIIELAAPPLAINRLHDRVAFFIKISLMHRSLTAWAQERLRDQFLYTYHTRPDEHERLEKRFEAGFGHNRPLRRLYLGIRNEPPPRMPVRELSNRLVPDRRND
jgi:hypothetical protein